MKGKYGSTSNVTSTVEYIHIIARMKRLIILHNLKSHEIRGNHTSYEKYNSKCFLFFNKSTHWKHIYKIKKCDCSSICT